LIFVATVESKLPIERYAIYGHVGTAVKATTILLTLIIGQQTQLREPDSKETAAATAESTIMEARDASVAKSTALSNTSKASSDSSRPGAHSARTSEIDILDERIAAKQNPGRALATRQPLNDFEADISAANSTGAPARCPRDTSSVHSNEPDRGAAVSLRNGRTTSEAPVSLKQSGNTNVSRGMLAANHNDQDQIVSRLDNRINAKVRGTRRSTIVVKSTDYRDAIDGDQQFNSGPEVNEKEEKKNKETEESAPQRVTTARGRINEPDLEFGSNGGRGHGYEQGLAVAVAVTEDEDEEEIFIPAAIEYDPGAKPPICKNRRVRLYACIALILLIVIVVGVVVAVTLSGNATQPTLAPTSVRENIGIQAQIASVIGEKFLIDPNSPQSLALDWIINEDIAELSPEADNFVQRYILALFYISTTQIQPWLSCNKPMEGEDNTCQFKKLLQVFPREVYEDVSWFRWLTSEHECDWAGVFCDANNQTRAIELPGLKIRGTFPTEIAVMPYLQSITLNWNELVGTLPTELASMKHLLNIELHYNFLTGSVPATWYSSQSIQRLNIGANMLTGTLSTEIGTLSSMKGFFIFENMINGTIPTEIGDLKFLSFTRWGRNFMTGTIPTELGNLTKVQEMWIHRNLYSGTIPSEFGKLRDMNDLRIHFNSLTGTFPEEFYNMAQLNRFDVYDCNMTGTISSSIAKLTNLAFYRIRGNQFSGTIPSQLGNITTLDTLWLQLNNFNGTMPIEVCERRSSRGLKEIDADCRSDNPDVAPLISCLEGCCTDCCDSYSEVCLTL